MGDINFIYITSKMPVVTRSQYAKNTLESSTSKIHKNMQPINYADTVADINFRLKIKELLNECHNIDGVKNRMIACLKLYKVLNKELMFRFKDNKPRWARFILTVYNKTIEFENQINEGKCNVNDLSLEFTFLEEICKTKYILENVILSNKDLIHAHPDGYTIYNNINQNKNKRPRRIIKSNSK